MGLTYQQAKSLGLERYWPDKDNTKVIARPEAVPPPSKAVDDGMTKLERDFASRANEAKEWQIFREVWREPIRFKVFGDRWYKPDFLTIVGPNGSISEWHTLWECKGYERAKDIQKLIAAADRYPWFTWVLVKRPKRVWECRYATSRGINREIWCPDWLR